MQKQKGLIDQELNIHYDKKYLFIKIGQFRIFMSLLVFVFFFYISPCLFF